MTEPTHLGMTWSGSMNHDDQFFFSTFSTSKPTIHILERIQGSRDQLFYTAKDDDAAAAAMIVEAASTKRSLAHTSTDTMTGLPSPELLNRSLAEPEGVVGIEHLLASKVAMKANLNMKSRHARTLLKEQQRQQGPELASCLEKYSQISCKLAQCRANYALKICQH